MKAKISSFLTCGTNSSFPDFFRMLDNSYYLKLECSSTCGFSWLLTVYFFLWNLKMVCKWPYKCKRLKYWYQISFSEKLRFTMRTVCRLTWITSPMLKQTKSKNNSLSDHLFFYRLWYIRSYIHSSLDIIYGFSPDASKNRLLYMHIQLYFALFGQIWNEINYLL